MTNYRLKKFHQLLLNFTRTSLLINETIQDLVDIQELISTSNFGNNFFFFFTFRERELSKVIKDSLIKVISIHNNIIGVHAMITINDIVCQICDQVGHSAQVYPSCPLPDFSTQANYMASDRAKDHGTWIIDSVASYV